MKTELNKTTTQQTTRQESKNIAQRPITPPHVVIIGAGFGGLEAAKALKKQPVKVTVIDRTNHHLFQPMLYQVASAGLSPGDISAPIRHVLRTSRQTDVVMGEVTSIDLQAQLVHLREGDQSIPYDSLIVATGASTNYFGHEDWARFAPGLKSLNDSLAIRRNVLLAFEAAERETDPEKRASLLMFVLVGAGPTGVELAGALAELVHTTFAHEFRRVRPGTARILLVGGPPRVLPHFPPSISKGVQRHLAKMGVEIRTGVHVTEIDEQGVMIGKERIKTRNITWTAGVKASPAGHWLEVPVDHAGRVNVQSDLTIPGHPNVFVIGDTARVTQQGQQLPGVAPVAMQEGRYVASVIADRIAGKNHTRPFHYVDKGTLATVGRGFGVVSIGPLRFTGLFAWFVWLFVHLFYVIGVPNRILVFLHYLWWYLTYQKQERIVLPEGDLPPV